MLYRSGCAPHTSHLVVGLCPPPVLRCVTNRTARHNRRLQSWPRPCLPSPFPFRLDFGLDRTRFDEWTSFCFLRALCRIFSHRKQVLQSLFLCRRLNLWICSLLCRVSRLFALVPKSHVPTCPSFLYSPSYRCSTSHRLPFFVARPM